MMARRSAGWAPRTARKKITTFCTGRPSAATPDPMTTHSAGSSITAALPAGQARRECITQSS
jgi:hypothetical protein